jgi:dihydroorotate dehydrogenase
MPLSALMDRIGRELMFTFEPERAHQLSLMALKSGLLPQPDVPDDPRLSLSLGGLTFPNPVGLAAGFDKNAEVPDAVLKLGFGFTEAGTITPRPQTGNPRPRIFRLVEDQGVINRLGFNNDGHEAALMRLRNRNKQSGIVGINVGANKDSEDFVADYEAGIAAFHELASYFTANISSPNTPGLRDLQAAEALRVLLDRVFDKQAECETQNHRKVPVFLKIAPDLQEKEMDDIATVVNGSELAGLVVSNTTLGRENLLDQKTAGEAGGLSGKPLFQKSTITLAKMRQRIKPEIALIGVGGIFSTEDVVDKLEAGASLVQLYTGMVYGGPSLPSRLLKGLSRHMDENNLQSIAHISGTKTEEWAGRPF